tara:strand:- start:407 stop:565 length:159 start_codon:yes stop_codon:yes gene_type:complete
MKKLLGILILGLLVCSNVNAGLFNKNEFKFERCYTDYDKNHDDFITNSWFLK